MSSEEWREIWLQKMRQVLSAKKFKASTMEGFIDIVDRYLVSYTCHPGMIPQEKAFEFLAKNKKSEMQERFSRGSVIFSFIIAVFCNAQSGSKAETVSDIDGNIYKTIIIGNQIWTGENYKATRYRDGTPIPLVTESKKWSLLKTPAYCWYKNDTINKEKYGALYNWYAVNKGQLAPAGWHVPLKSDWDALVNFLVRNGYNWDGTTNQNKVGKALAATTEWWKSRNKGAVGNDLSKNNSTGFSALPSGFRVIFGHFDDNGNIGGYWWTDTRDNDSLIHSCALTNDKSFFDRQPIKKNPENMSYGLSVRILKDR